MKAGERPVVSATYAGFLLCHQPDGNLVWKTPIGGYFPYGLAVCDLDGDGLDEALAATAGGVLYAVDNTGALLWTFDQTAPLFQVAVTTASSGLGGALSLLLVEPASMKLEWKKTNLGTHAFNSGKRFFDMALLDLNRDGKEDILLSNSWGENGRIFAYDSTGAQLYTVNDERIPNISYRMNLLDPIKLPDDEYVMGHFGNVLIRYELDGSCRDVLTGPYSFADGVYDPETYTYYMGSSVSGGDGIHAFQLDDPNWREAFENLKPVGNLASIEKNLDTLKRQIAAFVPPA